MQITIVDNKKQKTIVCCAIEAANIVGVCRSTMYNWAASKWVEHYNQYTLYFNVKVLKQKDRGANKKLFN